jgi:membrane protease YdiL (CAAX protease family)
MAATAPDRSFRPVIEALVVLTPTLYFATGLGLPTLWFLVPLVVITIARRPYEDYGLTLRNPGSILFHAIVSLAVFLPYAVGHYFWEYWYTGADFDLRLPSNLANEIVVQTMIVALPEEFFFRGYLQTQLDKSFGRPYRFLRADVGLGLPIAAGVFALCHVPFGGPARMIVFFPGLLYGWLRARTDTIVVPTLYHAASNILMKVMIASLVPHV